MTTKRYRVTDAAGPWVAGRKVAHGDILELTAEQAEYEALRGLIVPAGSSTPATETNAASAARKRTKAGS